MPEGDTVWRVARSLQDSLVGQELLHSDLRVPAHATANLAGRTVVGSRSRGKHLLLDIASSAGADPDVVLHTTLGMDGMWRYFPADARWNGGAAFQIRVVLKTSSGAVVGYRLPHVDLLRADDEGRVVGHLGPDLLGEDWSPSRALQLLASKPDRQVAVALMDQRNLAGIGNVYKSELCFIARVNPWQPVGAVDNLSEIVEEASRLLDLNRESVRRVTTGNARAPLWVYHRNRQPCRVCGTPVRCREQGPPTQRRQTWWCESCQPLR